VEAVHSGTTKNPDLQGSCSLYSHCSLLDRSEQNSSKIWHTVCYFL